ncbi:SNF2-related protein [Streptacidiphilus cavernicola]|uniref:SNF2-related protein n=1 Tax=Streptacidiphilus cavernicola TaxID=3342716 RepID=A0ABV6VPX8_9ACTN
MWVLHGIWQIRRAEHRLALWAEDGRPRADSRYGAEPSVPAELLGAVGPGLRWLADRAEEGEAALLLPTAADGTVSASPELVGPLAVLSDPRQRQPAVGLREWRVPVLLFDPDLAAQLLGELFDPGQAVLQPELPGTGLVEAPYGASLRWLTQVHDLAWRLVRHGRVLPHVALGPDPGPGLRPDSASPRALWLPALDGPAHREAAALAADCPPLCRGGARREAAGDRAGSGTASGARLGVPSGAELVADLLACLVDREVRAVLADGPSLLPRTRGRVRPAATATERWLVALTSENPVLATPDDALGPATDAGAPAQGTALPPDSAELTVLQHRLAEWRRSATSIRGPLRLRFRLVEPFGDENLASDTDTDTDAETDADRWRLEFGLQAVDEPSVLVEAADLWADRPAAAPLRRLVDRPEAAFLAELERAARRSPLLEPALLSRRPHGLDLDRSGALGFLREAAPLLADAGFGVLLPSWWSRRPALGLALSAHTAATVQEGVVDRQSLVGREDLVEFRWRAALDGEPLTDGEMLELAESKQALVKVRGQWFEADPARIAAAAAFLAEQDQQSAGLMSAGELLRLALDGTEPGTGLPIMLAEADGRLGELLRRVRATADALDDAADSSTTDAGDPLALEPVAVPADFGAELRPYQQRGLSWLVFLTRLGLGGVLADDMGLGKTVQTLALLAVEHAAARETARGASPEASRGTGLPSPGPTLIVCPMSLVGNWTRECERFAPMLRIHVHHGSGRSDGARLRRDVAGADVVITTYGLAQRDFAALRGIAWYRVVADEAHHIKNGATLQSRAVRALPAAQRLALTGTPVENRLAELHAVLDFANPGLFGSPEGFKERYAVPIERNASVRATAELRQRTRPFVLRRSKSDPLVAAELPRKQEMTVLCNLTAEQAALYQAVVADLLARIEQAKLDRANTMQRRGLVLAALTRLKQVCNHPAHYSAERGPLGRPRLAGRSGKLARLEEILEQTVATGDRTLCFTQYTEFGALLRPYLAERLDSEVLFLHGGMTRRQRDETVERFQAPDGPSVFLLSLRAGGVGLNLTAANQVVHLDRWWNPAVEDQATDRAFRLGQRRDVQVRRFVCVGTVEERVDRMMREKRALADAVVEEGESWLGDLSTDSLREVLALTEDAVSET